MSTSHHPVTEFAFLPLIPPTTLQNPQLISGILASIKAQPAWSGYPLHLFIHQPREGDPSASGDPSNRVTSIYIISGWASVQAHSEWIASPKNQELIRSFGDANLLTVGGLAHLDIDFTKLSFEECSQIIWRKRGINEALSWEDITCRGVGKDEGQSGSEGKVEARLIWSYRGRTVDEGVEDEYELVGFSDGELPEVDEEYTILHKWNVEALSGLA